jgi:predicted transcriptional regulator
MSDGLLKCSRYCLKNKECCELVACKHNIDYEDEFNCTLISIYKNGSMTLREIAERLGISFARVKQIEEKALFKMKKKIPRSDFL